MRGRHFLAALALVPAVSLATPSVPAAKACTEPLPEAELSAIRGVIGKYRQTWLAGDAEGVRSTFTSDAVLLPPHGADPVVGAARIREYWWPAGGPPTKIVRLDITTEQVGGNCGLAFARGHDEVEWTIEQAGTTQRRTNKGTYLNVFRREPDGVWRMTHHMWDDATK